MAKAVATVEDFDKLKNKDTGLVPMSFLVPTITERVGDIRGAEPYTALRWYNDGLAEPAKGKVKPSGEAQPTSQAESDDDKRRSAIAIASDWEGLHHLQRIALARNISGTGTDERLTAEDANKVIQAEVERRGGVAGSEGAGANALTTEKTPTP
ncbi:hypothetical protein [Methylorubrum zatmanii]